MDKSSRANIAISRRWLTWHFIDEADIVPVGLVMAGVLVMVDLHMVDVHTVDVHTVDVLMVVLHGVTTLVDGYFKLKTRLGSPGEFWGFSFWRRK